MSQGRQSAGHPVDIGSGVMYSEHPEFTLPGRFPLVWERRYSTSMLGGQITPLGPGWTSPVFAKLTRIDKDYHFFSPEGDLSVFPDPGDTVQKDGIIRNLGGFQELSRRGSLLAVTRWSMDEDGVTRYLFLPDRNGVFWPLRAIEDASGEGLELAWDDQGLLKGIRQKREKRTLAFTHAGRLLASVSFRHPDGRQQVMARYEYDANGRLAAAFDSAGFADRFQYDKDGRMTREMAKDGAVFNFKYDDKGRCIRTSGQDNYDLKLLRYLDHILMSEVVDSRGSVTRYKLNASGQIEETHSPLGGVSKNEFDDMGRVVAEIDPNGGKTEYKFDALGNLEATTDPLGNTAKYAYNEFRQAILITDVMGMEWKQEFDASARMTAATDPEGNRTAYEFDNAGNVVLIHHPGGADQKFAYDALGQEIAKSDAYGKTIEKRAYDAMGRVIAVTDVDQRDTRISWTLAGKVAAVRLPDGGDSRYEYDAGGNIVTAVDENGRISRFRFGPCNRLLERVDARGNRVSFKWGTEPGELLEFTNENGEKARFTRNAELQITAETGYDGGATLYKFDPAGRMIETTAADGSKTAFKRDANGKLVERKHADGTELTLAYDAMGRPIKAANAEGTLAFAYSPVGDRIKEEQLGTTLDFAFDARGNEIGVKSSRGFALEQEYDLNNELIALASPGAGIRISMVRHASGLEWIRKLPGGMEFQSEYDGDGRLVKKLLAQGAAASPVEHAYAYDGVGNLVAEKRGSLKAALGHDERGNLIQRKADLAGSESFEYDAAGNIKQAAGAPWFYGPGGKLISKPGFEFDYDAMGRLARKRKLEAGTVEEWEYAYNAAGELASVTHPSGDKTEFGYDPLGRRAWKRHAGATTRFVWNADTLFQEIRPDGKRVDFIFDPDSFDPIAQLADGKETYFVLDQIGTPRALYSPDSGVRDLEYTAMGKSLGPDAGTPLRFPGQYHDVETGLHYNRFRYYDPDLGRFISPDPLGLDAGPNLYRYAPDPYSWLDPFGLDIKKNKKDGTNREKKRAKQLEKEYPNDSVQRERTLRDADGNVVRDPVTGESRRVDIVVIDEDGSRVRRVEEVTSNTADKRAQAQKEKRIRAKGGNFVRDKRTKKLVKIGSRQKIHCTRMK